MVNFVREVSLSYRSTRKLKSTSQSKIGTILVSNFEHLNIFKFTRYKLLSCIILWGKTFKSDDRPNIICS